MPPAATPAPLPPAPRPWRRPMLSRSRHRRGPPRRRPRSSCSSTCASWSPSRRRGAARTTRSSSGHVATALVGYLMVFFAIWWAWMNFTWFASAYDTDDVPYRLLTLRADRRRARPRGRRPRRVRARSDFTVVTVGYVIMRVAMVAQWLRAARGDPSRRADRPPLRARHQRPCRLGWVAAPVRRRLRCTSARSWSSRALELAVPAVGRAASGRTTWHPRHIAERYGLFTLIVLGECDPRGHPRGADLGRRRRARATCCRGRRRAGAGVRPVVVVLPVRRGTSGCGTPAARRSSSATATTSCSARSRPSAPG